MVESSWTDKSCGFYCPFEEKGWLWKDTPYIIFLLVNILYLPVFLTFLSALLLIALSGLVILVVGYSVYMLLGKPLWISVRYKDGEAKTRLKKMWALPMPTTTESVSTDYHMCSDGDTNISELPF